MLPLELAVNSFRVAKQHKLQPKEYSLAIFQELELANENRLMALENIQANKAKVLKLYNKRVKLKLFIKSDTTYRN